MQLDRDGQDFPQAFQSLKELHPEAVLVGRYPCISRIYAIPSRNRQSRSSWLERQPMRNRRANSRKEIGDQLHSRDVFASRQLSCSTQNQPSSQAAGYSEANIATIPQTSEG
ncbi:hypothetical protein [Rubinisphaera brasiliensis]|uniref:hypothetical protein n=1 Tax=Rubinisphaera brasiliensis TaxID=119 RepID=UPI00059D6A95|nr:hypothetical protein [Rubinisphaera brasiliensis]